MTDEEFRKILSKAKEGDAIEQLALANMYLSSEDISEDILAYAWAIIAWKNGQPEAANIIEALHTMTKEEMEQVDEKVDEMIKENPNLIRSQSDSA